MTQAAGGIRHSLFEQLYVRGAIFLLALGLPKEWFQTYFGPEAQGSPLVTLVFLAVFGVSGWYLFVDLPYVVKAMRLDVFMVGFVATVVASYAWSADPGVTARNAMALSLTVTFGWYLAIRWRLEDVLKFVAETLVIGTIANLIWLTVLTQYGWNYDFSLMSRQPKGITATKNGLGQLCALSGLTFVIAARVLPGKQKLYYAAFAINAVVLVMSNSMTSIVAFSTLMVLMLAFRLFRLGREMFGAVVLLVIVAATAMTVFMLTAFGSVATSLGRDPTLTGRTELWSLVLKEVADRPFVGYGWGAFWQGFNSPARDVLAQTTWNPPDSHNSVLEYLLGVGLVGTALLLLSFFVAYGRAVKFVNRMPGAIALWPISFFTYVLLNSITEHGFVGRSLPFALMVMFALVLAQSAKEAGGRAERSHRARPTRPTPSPRPLEPAPSGIS
jgi:exopolysaccharide production protein ExoQ